MLVISIIMVVAIVMSCIQNYRNLVNILLCLCVKIATYIISKKQFKPREFDEKGGTLFGGELQKIATASSALIKSFDLMPLSGFNPMG